MVVCRDGFLAFLAINFGFETKLVWDFNDKNSIGL